MKLLWRSGEPWRDLTDDAYRAGLVTVVSVRGAARVLGRDDSGVWAWRVGKEWLPIDTWRLTPCGLIASTNDYLTTGTPLWFVAEGEQWGWWGASLFGEEIAAAIKARSVPFAPSHPAERCPAPYCRRAWSELAQALSGVDTAVVKGRSNSDLVAQVCPVVYCPRALSPWLSG